MVPHLHVNWWPRLATVTGGAVWKPFQTRVLQMAKLASALAHSKTKKLRFVLQKAQKLLAAPTGGCKKLRLKRRGGQKVSAQKRKSARFELPCSTLLWCCSCSKQSYQDPCRVGCVPQSWATLQAPMLYFRSLFIYFTALNAAEARQLQRSPDTLNKGSCRPRPTSHIHSHATWLCQRNNLQLTTQTLQLATWKICNASNSQQLNYSTTGSQIGCQEKERMSGLHNTYIKLNLLTHSNKKDTPTKDRRVATCQLTQQQNPKPAE